MNDDSSNVHINQYCSYIPLDRAPQNHVHGSRGYAKVKTEKPEKGRV